MINLRDVIYNVYEWKGWVGCEIMRDIRLGMNPELISHKGGGGGVIIHTSTGVIFIKIKFLFL